VKELKDREEGQGGRSMAKVMTNITGVATPADNFGSSLKKGKLQGY
jgi:hypothetical protein